MVDFTPMHVIRRHTPFHNQPFRPLPRPTGKPPFHLSLDDVLSSAEMQTIRSAGRIVFHIIGDTGGVKSPFAQQIVASHLETDYRSSEAGSAAALLCPLGDIVYYNRQASEHYAPHNQTLTPYPSHHHA